MLARDGSNMSQAQLASELGCDQSTVYDDIRVLKQSAQTFIFDLAKGDLAYYFKQSIDDIKQAKLKLGRYFSSMMAMISLIPQLKLMALKIIIQANETKFKPISDAPSVMILKSLEDRLSRIEQSNQRAIT